MFCGRCGTQIEDNALFCSGCGESVINADKITHKKHKFFTKKLALLLGMVMGVILITILLVSLMAGDSNEYKRTGSGGYKRTLDNYYKAHENNDVDLMYNSVIAQYWIDYKEKGSGDSYAMESIENSLKNNINDWNCGKNIKITYKIKNEKRATKEQLEELEENIYDWYAYFVYERDEFLITDAYVLDIDFTVKGEKGTESFHYPDGLLIIKENGRWRIPKGSISCSFYDNQ